MFIVKKDFSYTFRNMRKNEKALNPVLKDLELKFIKQIYHFHWHILNFQVVMEFLP